MGATYPLTLFYDASCPVCALEMDHLRERDKAARLTFVDISAPGFNPGPYEATLESMNAELHGMCADGRLLRGVLVLRLAYEAVGLGVFWRPTAWWPLRPVFDAGYRWFAGHRREISRAAAPLINAIRAWRARGAVRRMQRCTAGVCHLHSKDRSQP